MVKKPLISLKGRWWISYEHHSSFIAFIPHLVRMRKRMVMERAVLLGTLTNKTRMSPANDFQEFLGRVFKNQHVLFSCQCSTRAFKKSTRLFVSLSSTFQHTYTHTHTFWVKIPTACKHDIINMNPTWKNPGKSISSTSFNSLWFTERYPGAADEWDDPWISSDGGFHDPGDVWYRKKWWVFNMYISPFKYPMSSMYGIFTHIWLVLW